MTRRPARTAAAGVAVVALGLSGLLGTDAVPMAVADEPTVHVAAAGDFGASTDTRAVLDGIASSGADLALALGDLSYASTGAEQAWCDFVTRSIGAGFPFELVAGNHESNGLNGHINDFSACLPNQLPGLVGTYGRQWYVDVPAGDPLVRFVMISPALTFPDGFYSYTAGTPRFAWTAAAIDGARTAAIPWVVVGMHKPCLSLGMYTCEPGADLHNMLLEKKVDLVLSGHEHLYQRTHQLALRTGCGTMTPGVAADLDCIADSDAQMVRGAGTVFATVGTGGIAQRAVDLGDPEAPYFAAASGLSSATWGSLDLRFTASTLTATFARASGGTFSDAFTLGPPGEGNSLPTASFVASCIELDCTMDASASTDPDGTIDSYAWDFGDGSSGSGVTTTHEYASGGTRTVVLTVTDNQGATASTTRTVTTTSSTAPFAADTFTRTVTSGFGSADTGGAWRVTGSASNYSVSGGVGLIRPARGGTLDVSLPDATAADTELELSLTADKVATGGGYYIRVAPRRVAGVGEYRTNLRVYSNGEVRIALARTAGSAETGVAGAVLVPGLTFAAGDELLVRSQATGTNPTVLHARVWKAGTTEPTAWQVSATDSTAGLQASGAVGVQIYLSSSVTNAPVVFGLDDFVARAP